MARARGANAQVALGFNSGVYGAVPGSGFQKLPFASIDLGETRGLVQSDLLGYGRDPQAPSQDVANCDGNVVVPVDLRAFGYWLKMLFGAATSDTQGTPAAGSIAFATNPANLATVTINATVFTFKTSPAAATDIQIGATLADTITALVTTLNASADANVTPATYSADPDLTSLIVTHDTIGTAGNSFTLAASAATPSGATLAGGGTTGPYNHTFVPGGLTLPDAAVEIGMPDVPSYAMNYGVMANTIAIALQRSGHLNATIGLIAQGEKPRSGSSSAGTLTEILIERFAQGSGQISRDGAPLADITQGNFNFTNGLDKVEGIRQDGRISGIDPGMMGATIDFTSRFKDLTLLNLATNGTPVEVRFDWKITATKKLSIIVHNVYLPKPKQAITGPTGVMATYNGQGAEHPVLHKTLTAILVNDVPAY